MQQQHGTTPIHVLTWQPAWRHRRLSLAFCFSLQNARQSFDIALRTVRWSRTLTGRPRAGGSTARPSPSSTSRCTPRYPRATRAAWTSRYNLRGGAVGVLTRSGEPTLAEGRTVWSDEGKAERSVIINCEVTGTKNLAFNGRSKSYAERKRKP